MVKFYEWLYRKAAEFSEWAEDKYYKEKYDKLEKKHGNLLIRHTNEITKEFERENKFFSKGYD